MSVPSTRPNLQSLTEQHDRLRGEVDELIVQFESAKRVRDSAAARAVAAKAKPCQARMREISALLRFARVCPVEWTYTATEAEIEAKLAHPALVKVAAEPDATTRSALLLGPSKIGKSTACALALRRHVAAGGQVAAVWDYARALANVARLHPLGAGEAPELERARRAELLILDDLGLEKDPGEIVDVLHARYEAGLVTWTTSGLSLDELRQRYGEALVRRLVEGRNRPGRMVVCFANALRAVGP